MEGKTYGYVRVSTQVQNEARQLTAMREFGVPEENIIIEKQSGKDFRRPRYQSLVGALRTGGAGITRKFWSSGLLSPRRERLRLWCWTCLCWIPARGGT